MRRAIRSFIGATHLSSLPPQRSAARWCSRSPPVALKVPHGMAELRGQSSLLLVHRSRLSTPPFPPCIPPPLPASLDGRPEPRDPKTGLPCCPLSHGLPGMTHHHRPLIASRAITAPAAMATASVPRWSGNRKELVRTTWARS
jgi:hypothetical protein